MDTYIFNGVEISTVQVSRPGGENLNKKRNYYVRCYTKNGITFSVKIPAEIIETDDLSELHKLDEKFVNNSILRMKYKNGKIIVRKEKHWF